VCGDIMHARGTGACVCVCGGDRWGGCVPCSAPTACPAAAAALLCRQRVTHTQTPTHKARHAQQPHHTTRTLTSMPLSDMRFSCWLSILSQWFGSLPLYLSPMNFLMAGRLEPPRCWLG
jgi:hypothetical protein